MKIIFMGTPEFAVPSLEALHQNHEVKAVITAPDKPAGRGKKIRASAVKEFALENNIPVLQPANLKDEKFLTELKAFEAELFVVVAFRMLPKIVWQMPPAGTINLHASLLPQYRGAAPINWAIINGEKKTGLTTFFINETIDTGGIIKTVEVDIHPETTAGDLHDTLMTMGAALLLETLALIESGDVKSTQQPLDTTDLQTAPKLYREMGQIKWDAPAAVIHNLIRGLSPFPGAYTLLTDTDNSRRTIKIYRSRRSGETATKAPGTIVLDGGRFFVCCSDEMLELLELQMEGRTRMSAENFLRGAVLTDSSCFI